MKLPENFYSILESLFFFILSVDLVQFSSTMQHSNNKLHISHAWFIPPQIKDYTFLMVAIVVVCCWNEVRNGYSFKRRSCLCFIYTLNYICDRHDSYQHHYLMCYILFCFIFMNPKDSESMRLGILLLRTTFVHVYFWSCITKFEMTYLTGKFLKSALYGPIDSNDNENLYFFSLFSICGLAIEALLAQYWAETFKLQYERKRHTGTLITVTVGEPYRINWNFWFLMTYIPIVGIVFHLTLWAIFNNIRLFTIYMIIIYAMMLDEKMYIY